MGFWRKQQISFFLTSKCNLACYYCYIPKIEIDPEDQIIDIEFARVSLRDFFESNPSRTIRFFGAGGTHPSSRANGRNYRNCS